MLLLMFALACNDPSTVELEAIFRQNALQAQTLRVQWQRTISETPSMQQVYERLAEQQDKTAADASFKSAEREVAKRQAESIRQFLAKRASASTESFQQDYWSDREHFQFRLPVNPDNDGTVFSASSAWKPFPDDDPTPVSLPTIFGKIAIVSRGPATSRLFRRWNGRQHKGGVFAGLIGSKQPELASAHFPPLAMRPVEWGGVASPLDSFFDPNPIRERIIGHAQIKGVDTLVWERAWERSKAVWTVMIGYVDPIRAAIPLRLEIYGTEASPQPEHFAVPWEDRHVKLGVFFPTQVVECSRMSEHDGMVYPARGTIEHLQPLGLEPGNDVVVVKREEWIIHSIEKDRPMSEEMFALKFPANTVFVDQTRDETRLTGDVDGYSARAIGGLRPTSPLKPWWRQTWLLVSSLSALVLGLGVLQWRRRKS